MMSSEVSGAVPDKSDARDGSLTTRSPKTQQSQALGVSTIGPAAMRYLEEERAFNTPSSRCCLPVLKAYFSWFHPCFPVVDRADVSAQLDGGTLPKLLMHAMLMIGSMYCEESSIADMGFKDRLEARQVHYKRARLLFHADWERDEITLIRSVFLLSFWRGGPTELRDVRYWLGVAITLCESFGVHRRYSFSLSKVVRYHLTNQAKGNSDIKDYANGQDAAKNMVVNICTTPMLKYSEFVVTKLTFGRSENVKLHRPSACPVESATRISTLSHSSPPI